MSHERGWRVVEDACQQPGAQLSGRPVGSWGDVGVLSFGGSKLLTSGRGGAVLTSDAAIHQRMKIFAERGNHAFPLSELQAAVLQPQLAKLNERNKLRSKRVEMIHQSTAASNGWLRPVSTPRDASAAYYKTAWSFLPAESDAELRDQFLGFLQSCGVPMDSGFRGFTGRSQRRCSKQGALSVSEKLSRSTILLHHPLLIAEENAAHQVAEVLNYAVRRLTT